MATEISKITYYDLRWEARHGRLQPIVGRKEELARINRITSRRMNNNCLVVAPSGMGKTALLYGLATSPLSPPYQGGDGGGLPLVVLEASNFHVLGGGGNVPLGFFEDAFGALPSCVVCIDDFGALVYNKPVLLQNLSRLLQPHAKAGKVRFVLNCTPHEYAWISEQDPALVSSFELLTLKAQPLEEQKEILKKSSTEDDALIDLILQVVQRFPSLGVLPAAGLMLLDEMQGHAEKDFLYTILADKTGIPVAQLKANDQKRIQNLEAVVHKRIVGQDVALRIILNTLTRGALGLRSVDKPLASFLILGPSGVGKTETARIIAEQLFGRKESFLRLDMSEFSQEHQVARLLGAPPGYVGYDAGGALTNHVAREPYSLILLDELEKAHGKVFDIFLQLLDYGHVTSSRGEMVDFRHTVVIATSNCAVDEIIEAHGRGISPNVMPALTKVFRREFLNRFDATVAFEPLGVEELLQIAKLEMQYIQERVKGHKLRFALDEKVLRKKITELADPHFGARPVKRFIEEVCEGMVAKALMKKNN